MKTWLKVIVVSLLIVVLSACGSDKKLQEVFEKAQKVSEEQKSFHSVMDIDQKITMGSEEAMNSTSTIEMDMIVEPLAMHQNMQMDLGDLGKADIEMYVTEDGFYMYSPEEDLWIKFPDEMYDEMVGEMAGAADPQLDMDMFQKYLKDFKFEQTDDNYVLTLNAEGEQFTDLLKELMSENLPADLEEVDENLFDSIEVNKLHVVLEINKDTFYTTAFTMDMDMALNVEGENMEISQVLKGKMSKFNEIEKIEIPQEVLDNAISFEELGGF